jgi:thiol-disulfide isomerase/thioredoxin
MKKLLLGIFIAILLSIAILPINTYAKEKINLYLFYGEGCPHCEAEIEMFKDLEKNYDINIYKYEVWYNDDNMQLLKDVLKKFNKKYEGVPFTVIGNKTYVGYSDAYTKDKILEALDYYKVHDYQDVVKSVLDNKNIDVKEEKDKLSTINLPIFGEVNTQTVSLPIITTMMGLIDGFNPCSMWVLLFLISMLLGMKDRKKMWVLGLTFIFISALTYFTFMAAWLNLVILLSAIIWIRTMIGVFGLGAGLFNIRSFIKTKEDGCEVVSKEKRTKLFDRIKKFTHEKSFLLALLGISLLAISVNLIELLCSLGLPVIYTEILSMAKLSTLGYYGYLLLYTFFFMIDDIIIFFIAMKTLQLVGISTKYKKYSHLIGGILMAIIGILLIFKPDLLLFG